MNYARLVAAAVAATVFDAIYGFLMYGQAMAPVFSRYAAVYRPADDMSHMPVLVASIFVGTLAAAYIYAKGYEGGSGLVEGLRFGVLMGLLLGSYMAGVNYGILRIGKRMALTYGIGWLGEWVLVGLVIGLVYKPVAEAVKRAAGV